MTICTPRVPFDEIGLLMLCRMYHLKLCVLLENHYWCALNGSSVEASKIIIAFHGVNLNFWILLNVLTMYESQEYHLQPCKSLDVLPCPAKKGGKCTIKPHTHAIPRKEPASRASREALCTPLQRSLKRNLNICLSQNCM